MVLRKHAVVWSGMVIPSNSSRHERKQASNLALGPSPQVYSARINTMNQEGRKGYNKPVDLLKAGARRPRQFIFYQSEI